MRSDGRRGLQDPAGAARADAKTGSAAGQDPDAEGKKRGIGEAGLSLITGDAGRETGAAGEAREAVGDAAGGKAARVAGKKKGRKGRAAKVRARLQGLLNSCPCTSFLCTV